MTDAKSAGIISSGIKPPEPTFQEQAAKVSMRARAHGVNIKAGEPILVVMEKLVDRLDQYRDMPQNKGRLIVE